MHIGYIALDIDDQKALRSSVRLLKQFAVDVTLAEGYHNCDIVVVDGDNQRGRDFLRSRSAQSHLTVSKQPPTTPNMIRKPLDAQILKNRLYLFYRKHSGERADVSASDKARYKVRSVLEAALMAKRHRLRLQVKDTSSNSMIFDGVNGRCLSTLSAHLQRSFASTRKASISVTEIEPATLKRQMPHMTAHNLNASLWMLAYYSKQAINDDVSPATTIQITGFLQQGSLNNYPEFATLAHALSHTTMTFAALNQKTGISLERIYNFHAVSAVLGITSIVQKK